MAADAVRLHAKLANVLWRIGRLDEAGAAFHAALELGDRSTRSSGRTCIPDWGGWR